MCEALGSNPIRDIALFRDKIGSTVTENTENIVI
jgi:hypothetical protein